MIIIKSGLFIITFTPTLSLFSAKKNVLKNTSTLDTFLQKFQINLHKKNYAKLTVKE